MGSSKVGSGGGGAGGKGGGKGGGGEPGGNGGGWGMPTHATVGVLPTPMTAVSTAPPRRIAQTLM